MPNFYYTTFKFWHVLNVFVRRNHNFFRKKRLVQQLTTRFNMADVGNKRFCLFLLLAVQSLPKSAAVLTARAGLIDQYFNLGLNYSEILLFLGLSHGCFLSIRQLKRILKHLGLGRRNRSNPQIICEAIEEELHGSGSMLGYRQIWCVNRQRDCSTTVKDNGSARSRFKV